MEAPNVDKGGAETIARLKAGRELEEIAARLAANHPKSRILSIILTKLEEAALWYAKLLKEDLEK